MYDKASETYFIENSLISDELFLMSSTMANIKKATGHHQWLCIKQSYLPV